jgi:hypothetical protein
MADWQEELKVERSKQTRHDHCQQYQAYIDSVEGMDSAATEQVGKMQGKAFKRLGSENNALSNLFSSFLQKNN